MGNGAQGHKDCDINTAGVVEDGADNLLDARDTGFAEGRCVVRRKRKLGRFSILFGSTLVWTVLWFGALMLKTLEDLLDVPWH